MPELSEVPRNRQFVERLGLLVASRIREVGNLRLAFQRIDSGVEPGPGALRERIPIGVTVKESPSVIAVASPLPEQVARREE